jgi:histidinol dehydrogenase
MRVRRFEWDGESPRRMAADLQEVAPSLQEVAPEVAEAVAAVRERGDDAVLELTQRFDATERAPERLRVAPQDVARAAEELERDVREALEIAARNIRAVAEAQMRVQPTKVELPEGQTVTVRRLAVRAAGIYAPGGRAAYPSTALMCCVPARVAGVERVAVASPPRADGTVSPVILAACAVAGADEVYAMGGAQAVAALAYGTESVEPVDVIAGPGSRHVQEAKRQLFGAVGIDGLAGPTDLTVVVDASTDPEPAALDLLAQAEHGADSPLAVVSTDAAALARIGELVESLAGERPSVADAPLALVLAPDLDAALSLVDALAPEHLQLMFEGADEVIASERVAGCVFVGPMAGTAFGDYVAGSNHVLPTEGRARFGGPLGPHAFMRCTSVVEVPASAAASLAPPTDALARAEGLPVHGESVRARARR